MGRINAVLDSWINNRDLSHLKTGLDQCPLFIMCLESSVYSVFTSENVHGQKLFFTISISARSKGELPFLWFCR